MVRLRPRLAAAPRRFFWAGAGVLFLAGAGVLFWASAGVLFLAGAGVLFWAGAGVLFWLAPVLCFCWLQRFIVLFWLALAFCERHAAELCCSRAAAKGEARNRRPHLLLKRRLSDEPICLVERQSTWSGHTEVKSVPRRRQLLTNGLTTDAANGTELGLAGGAQGGRHLLGDLPRLRRQLARRRDDQPKRALTASQGHPLLLFVRHHHHRQCEDQSLTRACEGDADHVPAGKDDRQPLDLDRRRLLDPLGLQVV
eukprot:scaffold3084_cov108-Isochrysis_galbana.AAC.2